MDDDDLATVKRMLSYLYTLDYEDQDWTNMEEATRHGDSITVMKPENEDETGPQAVCTKASISPTDQQEDLEHESTSESRLSTEAESTPSNQQVDLEHETTLKTRSRKADHFRMLNDISVYAIADKYDIPPLKLLALNKFATLATAIWPHYDFPAIVKAAFESSPDNDQGLRSIVTKVCADHIGDLLLLKGPSASDMKDLPLLGFELLSIIKKRNDDDYKRLLEINAVLEVELDDMTEEARGLKQQRDFWKGRHELWISNIDRTLESASESRVCRHCHEVGQMILERIQHPTDFSTILRCPKCRTKHPLSRY